MRLSEDRALELLRANSHGFMATQHPERGIDVGPPVPPRPALTQEEWPAWPDFARLLD